MFHRTNKKDGQGQDKTDGRKLTHHFHKDNSEISQGNTPDRRENRLKNTDLNPPIKRVWIEFQVLKKP